MEATAPAELGEPTSSDPLVAQLHRAVLADQPRRVRRCLARGCRPDAVNSAGQTALFCAAFGARRAAVAELLRRGADPNARCDGGYTAVHGACYAGRLRVLRRLLECGGDLRLHDLSGRRPADWARLQPDPLRRRRVLQLIETARLAALTPSGRDLLVERSSSFSAGGGGGGGVRTLLRRLIPRETPRRAAAAAVADVDLADLARSVQSVGFGAVYYGGGEAGPGALAVLPLATERSLEPDRGARGYPLGAYTEMAARLYLGSPVSVRRLVERPPPGAQRDLLIGELEAARRLHHPALLLLMAVCPSENLDAVTLVFERVPLGSLHHCRYTRGLRLAPAAAADILLQVCGALQFVHAARWLHCAVTSHAVQLLTPAHAKLACLEHALHVPGGPPRPQRRLLACRADGALYNWLAPEVLRDAVPTESADTYSFCALTWELMHGQVPWDGLSADEISEQAEAGGRSLTVSADLCPVILRDVLELGLRADPQKRDLHLDEARFMLTNLRDGVQKTRPRSVANTPAAQTPIVRPATPSSRPGSRPATPASTGRRLKPPAPAPPRQMTPARLSRTLSPDALRPPLGRDPTPQRLTRTLDTTISEPRTGVDTADCGTTDPYTGLRRTPTPRAHVRSATWQTSPTGSWKEATAIKPASHRLTRHGSSCSLSKRQATGATSGSGATPWPPAEWDGETPPAGRRHLASPRQHSISLDGQAPRPPRFSPSPPSVRSLGQLMAELDMDHLFPPLHHTSEQPPVHHTERTAAHHTSERTDGPQRVHPPAAAQPQAHSAQRTIQGNSPVCGPRPAAGRATLRPASTTRSYGSAAARGAERGTRSLPRLAPLVSDIRGVTSGRSGPAPGPGPAPVPVSTHAPAPHSITAPGSGSGSGGAPISGRAVPTAMVSGRWRRREMEVQASAVVTDTASQTHSSTERGAGWTTSNATSNGGADGGGHSNGPGRDSSSGPAPNSSSTSSGNGQHCQTSTGSSSNGPTRTTSTTDPTSSGRVQQMSNGSSGSAPSHAVYSRTTSTEVVQSSNVHTTISSDEQMVSYSKQNFAARREFFSVRAGAIGGGGSTGHSQSDSALRLPQGVKLNPALLLRRDPQPSGSSGPSPMDVSSSPPAGRALLLGQPRPYQRAAGAPAVTRVPYTSPGEPRRAEGTAVHENSGENTGSSNGQHTATTATAGPGADAAVTSTPHRPAAARPEPPAVSSLSSGTPNSGGAAGHRLNVTFRAEVLEFSAPTPPDEPLPSPPESPPESDDDRCYYDDDLASPDAPPPHLQLLERDLPEPPPSPPPHPPPYAACLDDGGRESPLSMDLPSSAAGSDMDDLPTLGLDAGHLSAEDDRLDDRLDDDDDEVGAPLTPLHVSESGGSDDDYNEELELVTGPRSARDGPGGGGSGGSGSGPFGSPCITSSETTRSDGSRVRLFEVACERGFETLVETRASQDGQCTVTCTNTALADGATETYRQTVSADQVQTQIVVADR